MTTPIPFHDWKVDPLRENAQMAMGITAIYPVRSDVALVVTNCFGHIRLTQWVVLERFMKQDGELVNTIMSIVAWDVHMSKALDQARIFARAVYNVDISSHNDPF